MTRQWDPLDVEIVVVVVVVGSSRIVAVAVVIIALYYRFETDFERNHTRFGPDVDNPFGHPSTTRAAGIATPFRCPVFLLLNNLTCSARDAILPQSNYGAPFCTDELLYM